MSWTHMLLVRKSWLGSGTLGPDPGPTLLLLPGSTAPLGWPAEQAAGLRDGQRVPWGGRLGWGAGVVGGSRCKIMGPPGRPGEQVPPWGVRLPLFRQLWWAPCRSGIPVSPWATLACSEVVQMPGHRHRAKPLPWVSATRQVAMTTSTFILVPLSGHGPAFVTKP